jgi:hypothetical protein
VLIRCCRDFYRHALNNRVFGQRQAFCEFTQFTEQTLGFFDILGWGRVNDL